jgi:hypothetical protein
MAEKFNYPQDVIWVTKSGAMIRLGDMTDVHLMNTHKMLLRQAKAHDSEAVAAMSYGGNPDSMGSYYADQAMNESLDRSIEYTHKAEPFWDELKRRFPDETNVRSYVERLSGRSVRRQGSSRQVLRKAYGRAKK